MEEQVRHNLRAVFAQWKMAAKSKEEEVSPSRNGAVGLLFLQLKWNQTANHHYNTHGLPAVPAWVGGKEQNEISSHTS